MFFFLNLAFILKMQKRNKILQAHIVTVLPPKPEGPMKRNTQLGSKGFQPKKNRRRNQKTMISMENGCCRDGDDQESS